MAVIKEVKGKESFTPPLKPSSDSSFSPSFSLLTAHFAYVALIQNRSFMHRDLGSALKIHGFATVSHIAAAALIALVPLSLQLSDLTISYYHSHCAISC